MQISFSPFCKQRRLLLLLKIPFWWWICQPPGPVRSCDFQTTNSQPISEYNLRSPSCLWPIKEIGLTSTILNNESENVLNNLENKFEPLL